MIENIWHNFTPTSEIVNKDNDDQVFSSIFKYFLKSPKKTYDTRMFELNWAYVTTMMQKQHQKVNY
jgi:hypothetical protein